MGRCPSSASGRAAAIPRSGRSKARARIGRQLPCPLRPQCGRVRDRKDSVDLLAETFKLLLAPGVEPAPDAIAELQAVLGARDTGGRAGAERQPVREAGAGAGLVGARLIGPDGLLVQAGGIASTDGSLWSYGHGH